MKYIASSKGLVCGLLPLLLSGGVYVEVLGPGVFLTLAHRH